MKIPNVFTAYDKVRKTILSCNTADHVRGAKNMVTSFGNMFPNEYIYYDALSMMVSKKEMIRYMNTNK